MTNDEWDEINPLDPEVRRACEALRIRGREASHRSHLEWERKFFQQLAVYAVMMVAVVILC